MTALSICRHPSWGTYTLRECEENWFLGGVVIAEVDFADLSSRPRPVQRAWAAVEAGIRDLPKQVVPGENHGQEARRRVGLPIPSSGVRSLGVNDENGSQEVERG